MTRQYLQIPGPSNIPASVLNAMNREAINHRGVQFENLLNNLLSNLKTVYKTSNDILIFPSSGSGCLEAAIVNCFSFGDEVIAVNMGVFSKRFGEIAESFCLKVKWVNVEWGKPLECIQLEQALIKYPNVKGVLLTHSETSTSVLNNIKELSKVIRDFSSNILVLVDAVSSLAISELQTDKWGLDVVVAGSQKGLMMSGGLGTVSVSKRALEASKYSNLPKWYWDFNKQLEKTKNGRMAYTPAISLFFGLQESLRLIKEEGLETVLKRHKTNKELLHKSLEALGLELFVKDKQYRAESVTAVILPKGVNYNDLSKALKNQNVIIGGGLAKLNGIIFRIGHLGMLNRAELFAIIGSLEVALHHCGYKIKAGSGTSELIS